MNRAHIDTLSDLEYDCLNRVLNFGRGPFLARVLFRARGPKKKDFYLKSYDDDIWYVGTLSDLEYDCQARSALNQARSNCVLAR